MKTEIKFTKYQKRGAYHWQQMSKNPFRFNAFVAARYQQVIKALPTGENLKILDVGCGDGVLVAMIARDQTARVTGIDTDADSLEAAKNRLAAFGDRVQLVEASGYSLPFEDNVFDVVVAAEMIEHLQYIDGLLTEIKRVLKPGGLVIITTPVKLFDKPEDPMHVQEFTPRELKQVLAKHFSQVEVTTSHNHDLKKVYLWRFGSLGRFWFEPFRWLLNLWVLVTGMNLFSLSFGKNTNQLATAYK